MGSRSVVVRDGFTNTDSWPGLECSEPSLADQSQAKDCDVNVIVARFMKTGVLPGVNKQALYGDFSDVGSYQEACNIVLHAQQQFESLSADVRKRFGNDPAEFLAFCSDPQNKPEMIKLGLVEAPALGPDGKPLGEASSASGNTPAEGAAPAGG